MLLGNSLEEKLRAKIEKKCVPGGNNTHTLGDILGSGATVSEPLEAENVGAWCANFGGGGTIGSLNDWVDCVVAAHTCEARQASSVQYPRALEWLDAVRPFMADVSPPASDPTKVMDALAGLDGPTQRLKDRCRMMPRS